METRTQSNTKGHGRDGEKHMIFSALMTLAIAVSVSITPLQSAIWQVETSQCESDCPKGDNGAATGPLQIHRACWEDVKRDGENYSDCEGLDYSIQIFQRYMLRYATEKRLKRCVTDQDRARIWNGGPNGYKRQSTEVYWEKVQNALLE